MCIHKTTCLCSRSSLSHYSLEKCCECQSRPGSAGLISQGFVWCMSEWSQTKMRSEESWVRGFISLSVNNSHSWSWPRRGSIKQWEKQVWGWCELSTPPGCTHEGKDIRDLLVEIVLYIHWKGVRNNSAAYGLRDRYLNPFFWATLKIQSWLEVTNISICLHGLLLWGKNTSGLLLKPLSEISAHQLVPPSPTSGLKWFTIKRSSKHCFAHWFIKPWTICSHIALSRGACW